MSQLSCSLQTQLPQHNIFCCVFTILQGPIAPLLYVAPTESLGDWAYLNTLKEIQINC